MAKLEFKYVRIQGKEFAKNTMYAKGIFSMCWKLIQQDVMDAEDKELYLEIDSWFAENLPWPPQCKNREPVVCWFKTENSAEMLKMIRPALWLLEKYEHPYFLVYTNTPGEIVYEDQYQVAVKVPGILNIEEVQESERRYIEQYLVKPCATDWKYFWGIIGNIVFRRKRSK